MLRTKTGGNASHRAVIIIGINNLCIIGITSHTHITIFIRADLLRRTTQADSDVDSLGAMLKESQQTQGDRIVCLEKKLAAIESENSSLQQLLRISIDDNARMKAEKEAAVLQLRITQVAYDICLCEVRNATSDTLVQDSTRDELQSLREGIAAGTAATTVTPNPAIYN